MVLFLGLFTEVADLISEGFDAVTLDFVELAKEIVLGVIALDHRHFVLFFVGLDD
jgi:hypothetical protein